MQEHGLCFCSLIHPDDLHLYKDRPDLVIEEINIGPPSNQSYFWVRNCRVAIPEILAELIRQRKSVKAEQATTSDSDLNDILEQRQLSFKLVSNACYGATGFEFFPWPILPVAVCTTTLGRKAIALTKKFVEETYNAKVLYGDSKLPLFICDMS